MEACKNRDEHIDAIRKRFGITLAAVSKYNSQHGDEIKHSGEIFRLEAEDREKTLALLYMVSANEQDAVIRKFRKVNCMDDTKYNSPDYLVTQYGTMLAAALIYNQNFYAMAINYHGAIYARLTAAEAKEDSPGKNSGNIVSFPVLVGLGKFRMAFGVAAVLAVVFTVALLLIFGGGAGRRISNDWITGLTPPQKGHDGLSFISVGGDGPRIGIKSPLMGIAMGAQAADTAKTAAYYTKAIRADKNNAALYVNRGVAYTLGGYIDSAIKDFNKAIKLDPNNSSAYFNRAIAYMGNGETGIEPAIADLMTVVAINSDDSQLYYETYYTLGSLYIRQYEFDDAKPQALLEKALDAFSHIQGYRDADIIFDYISRLL